MSAPGEIVIHHNYLGFTVDVELESIAASLIDFFG
jgi:hypothetical protein